MDAPTTPTTAADSAFPVPVYEIRSGLTAQFHDFDDRTVYDEYLLRAIDKGTNNFAVRFGAEKASIATDLGAQDVTALLDFKLSKREEEGLPVTWM